MEKYLQYSFSDFAQEPSFINYVRKTNQEDESFWENWIEKHPGKQEECNQARLIVRKLMFKEPEVDKAKEDDIWDRIKAETQVDNKTPVRETPSKQSGSIKELPAQSGGANIRRLVLFAAAAAALLALFFFLRGTMGAGFDTQLNTQLAETQTVQLPDGSIAHLNADSELFYDKGSWNDQRRLKLKGEAFFSVEKGARFTVETPLGPVEVLGTSFNVYARDGELKVYCASGKVGVKSASKQTILTANQQVEVVNKKHFKREKVSKEMSRSSWQKGVYYYDALSLKKVVQDLERQLNIEIDLDAGLEQMKYSGSFAGKGVEKALSEVCWPLDLKYELNGRKVKIFK